ncbi:MAG: hypothetical protein EU541_00315 [Promethearchaeota archaeon]|nr:MAG: hypothetical protein EU541_00315 [Candidatus Lokiarchaeota archaeon]
MEFNIEHVGPITGAIISFIGTILIFIATIGLFLDWTAINTLDAFIFRILSIGISLTIVFFSSLGFYFQLDNIGDKFTGSLNLVFGFIAIFLSFIGSVFNIDLVSYSFGIIVPTTSMNLIFSLDGIFIMVGGAVGLL